MIELLRLPDPAAGDAARYARLRRPPRHADEALTGTTRAWLRRLPASCRPLRLCTRFPRVANRIAWCWSDHAEAGRVLADLLEDRRGGRRGFPRPIVLELERLRDLHSGRGSPPPEGVLTQLKRRWAAG